MSPRNTTIVGLAVRGMNPAKIARHLREDHDAVRQVVARARRNGYPIPHFREPTRLPMTLRSQLSAEVAARLDGEALKRGLSAPALVARILSNIAEDDLFGAVLEDG